MDLLFQLVGCGYKISAADGNRFGEVFTAPGVSHSFSRADTGLFLRHEQKLVGVDSTLAVLEHAQEERWRRRSCGTLPPRLLAARASLASAPYSCVQKAGFRLAVMNFGCWRFVLLHTRLRTISTSSAPPVLIFTDGAVEGDARAQVTLGAVLHDQPDGNPRFFFGEEVRPKLLRKPS